MRKEVLLSLFLISVLFIAGCASMGEKSKTSAVVGGLLGAAVGGIVGHQSGHGLEGAAIGGAAGAISGGLIGNRMDKKALATNPNHITVIKIAEMASKDIPDAVIIGEIQRTNSVYTLSSEVITYLKEHGVSDRVVDYMMSND